MKLVDDAALRDIVAALPDGATVAAMIQDDVAAKAGKALPFSAHNPDFRVDLNAIPVGAKVGALSVLELMAKS